MDGNMTNRFLRKLPRNTAAMLGATAVPRPMPLSERPQGTPRRLDLGTARMVGAKVRTGKSQRKRLEEQLLSQRHKFLAYMSEEDALSRLRSNMSGLWDDDLRRYSVAVRIRRTAIKTGERRRKIGEKEPEPNPRNQLPKTPVFKTTDVTTSYRCVDILLVPRYQALKEGLFLSALALSLACGIAYLAGAPPPQRFLFPNKEYSAALDACNSDPFCAEKFVRSGMPLVTTEQLLRFFRMHGFEKKSLREYSGPRGYKMTGTVDGKDVDVVFDAPSYRQYRFEELVNIRNQMGKGQEEFARFLSLGISWSF
jgi:hypothetical protein